MYTWLRWLYVSCMNGFQYVNFLQVLNTDQTKKRLQVRKLIILNNRYELAIALSLTEIKSIKNFPYLSHVSMVYQKFRVFTFY